jgi:fused signal recognition particle receptor
MSLLKIFSSSSVKNGLDKSSSGFSSKISQIFTHRKLSEEVLEDLEDMMITSDMGIASAGLIIKNLRAIKFDKDISPEQLKDFLVKQIEDIVAPCQKTLPIEDSLKPQVIIVNGVNGAGKTTSIGKMARSLADNGKKVVIAACDTFRAGATDQLKIWADRANCQIISCNKEGEDPASVAHRAFMIAKEQKADILLVDTAGRLQNKQNLMDELRKINNVISKIDNNAPHENILVLDATSGQNAKSQMEIFNKIVGITGIIITKLDGTAKGGILVALAQQFKKPIYAVGVGEKIADLQEFDAKKFAENLVAAN